MRVLILRCGQAAAELVLPATLHRSAGVEIFSLPAVPARGDLKFLSDHTTELLPVDPTPSLEEIQAQPRVEHQAAPQLAPQQPVMPLRIIVLGSDAALSAVLTRLMRADALWPQIGFVPVTDAARDDESTAARNWSLPTDPAAALKLALTGEVKPVPLIRNDAGQAVAGSATITQWDGGAMTGEIIVDDATLVQQDARGLADGSSAGSGGATAFGARLVPMLSAPGIAAAAHTAQEKPRGLFARWRKNKGTTQDADANVGKLDPSTLVTGRAVQAGGPEMAVHVDGVRSPRPQKRVTFYRHLRDLQIIRP
ncbi:hypothetical protein COPR103792_06680 [Corynebacterium propinquum]|uniref:Uncharacterized protein n=1 Tax=Corynebacterium propinquum TaxID=43769 RepID=A0AAP4BTR2_9CORY|nr:hypothetical protein [Corynebacterium propinquum]MCT1818122.1 hypothetical protein [Corynebacterium propinquum]MDK4238398.1 hypothetical protein [Corynebacterium propinquum]MDK4282294.1 hypothetical protein [Corynebacterium propinquum]MDK4319681.1 hypothetical protein [Corynebacterium propinquum]MDK4325129.1 hypothetical protein [Corynebacterium propinquum]